MKKDPGVNEMIGAVMLIALTITGAGMVMAFILQAPDRAMPILNYSGCEDTSGARCIVHQGGATLYEGQYYLQGVNKITGFVPGVVWTPGGCGVAAPFCTDPFRLENRICTSNPNVDEIQLIIIDETGHTLHGSVLTAGSCTTGVSLSRYGGGCPPPLTLLPLSPGSNAVRNDKTCGWICITGSRAGRSPALDPNNPGSLTCDFGIDPLPDLQFTASHCYVRGQTPSKSVLYLYDMSPDAHLSELRLIYSDNERGPRRGISKGYYYENEKPRREIIGVEILGYDGNITIIILNTLWCDCPPGMKPDPTIPDGDGCISVCESPPTRNDGDVIVCDDFLHFVPTGAVDVDGCPLCTCEVGYTMEIGPGGIPFCEPV